MLTCIGFSKTVAAEREPNATRLGPSLAEASKQHREDPETQLLWQDLKSHCIEMKKHLYCADMAVCLEICPTTFQDEQSVQLHAHVFLRSNEVIRLKGISKVAFR